MIAIDSLVDSYLGAVAWALRDLPPHRRDDLLTDLREHIAAARADLDPETEAGVRTILDRLGDPASIAAEARRDDPPRPAAVPPAIPPAVPPALPRRSRSGTWIAVAVVVGVVLVMCIVGVLGLVALRTGPDVVEQGPVPAEQIPTPSPSHTG